MNINLKSKYCLLINNILIDEIDIFGEEYFICNIVQIKIDYDYLGESFYIAIFTDEFFHI